MVNTRMAARLKALAAARDQIRECDATERFDADAERSRERAQPRERLFAEGMLIAVRQLSESPA